MRANSFALYTQFCHTCPHCQLKIDQKLQKFIKSPIWSKKVSHHLQPTKTTTGAHSQHHFRATVGSFRTPPIPASDPTTCYGYFWLAFLDYTDEIVF